MSAERFAAIESRLDALEGHGLPARVTALEASLTRITHQLDLVFAQGQANSRALGDQRLLLERVNHLLEVLVKQNTPAVEPYREPR